MRIAILDDDQELCRHLALAVKIAGHSVLQAHSGREMLKLLRQESFDLLLLDWEVPDVSGLEILDWARRNLDPSPPVIMVTARVGEADIVAGLKAGADDYVTKPVNDEVLRARVEALLRRTYSEGARRTVEVFGDYAFDPAAGIVKIAGTAVDVTAKEFALALLLFRNLHRPLSRGHITEMVWGRTADLATRTLDSHISMIRKSLRLRPENGFRLSSVYSFGYRLEQLDILTESAERKAA